jgi:hypothetical protein
MKKILIGVVIGALITTFLFIRFQPKPGPGKPVKVVENPTKAEEKKADVIIQEQKTGQLTSRVPVKPISATYPYPGRFTGAETCFNFGGRG